MGHLMDRRTFLGAAGLAGAMLLGACSGGPGGSGAAASASAGDQGAHVSIGTLATEDILPYWAAEAQGMFSAHGLDAEIVTFQSATELISAISAGEADLAMTDIMVTASLVAGGTDVQMRWVTLGADASQGRFGIMAGPGSDVKDLADLAGVPIGVGSNTILEYVMDKLLGGAGVAPDQIVVEELQKLPVRYQSMVEGKVAAAALPATLLALGEANGCVLVADDTHGKNISQSVMVARTDFLNEAGDATLQALAAVWDEAAKAVDDDPESFRSLLVEKANLPAEIADTYPISTYPTAQLPTAAMVKPVLEWMQGKGYLTREVAYDEATGALSVQ